MRDWEKAGMEEIVCLCSKVTKDDVIEAIVEGAETVEQVVEKTRMKCEDGSARDCRENVQALLDTYLAAAQGIESG